MAALWHEITHLTKSPIEMIPTTLSPSSTGRCRIRLSVMRCRHFSTGSRGWVTVKLADMISATLVSRERLPRSITLRVVAFGNHSDQAVGFHHEQRANVFIIHQFDRFKNRCLRGDRKNVPAFLIQDPIDSTTNVHIWKARLLKPEEF